MKFSSNALLTLEHFVISLIREEFLRTENAKPIFGQSSFQSVASQSFYNSLHHIILMCFQRNILNMTLIFFFDAFKIIENGVKTDEGLIVLICT